MENTDAKKSSLDGMNLSEAKLLRTVKIMAVTLVISLAFTFASSFELYKLIEKYNHLQSDYIALSVQMEKEKRSHSAHASLQIAYQPYAPVTPDKPKKLTLSQKNKNPLNIKRLGGGQKWQGQIGVDRFGHVIFTSWEHGVRAASFTLKAYARRHKVDTVEDLVSRFCEAKGKAYIAYVNYICRRLGVKSNEKIDLVEHMPKLLRIMARYESGMPLPEELFVPYDVIAFL